LRPGTGEPFAGERLAIPFAFVRGMHHKRPEQQCASLGANGHRCEADPANEPAVEPAREAQRRHRLDALPDAVGGTGEAARPEGLARKLGKQQRVVLIFVLDLKDCRGHGSVSRNG